jgi:DNA-binding transcriptional LysR family regulator
MTEFDMNQIRRLDGSLLLVFRELLRLRRATAVANRLGLSPSAVSHALTRLRDLFGDPLFIRRPHGLEPTRRALELGPRIDSLIEMAAQTLGSDASFDPAESERRFIITAPEFVSAIIGAPLLRIFADAAPRASFGIFSESRTRELDALRRGECDLSIGRFGALPPGLVSEVLYEDAYCIAARKGHPRIRGSIDMDAYCTVGAVFAHAEAETAGDTVYPSREAVRVSALVPRWLTALQIASSTDAFAGCPRRLAERQAEMLNLQIVDFPFGGDPIVVSVVRRADAADAGIDWLLAQVRAAVAA